MRYGMWCEERVGLAWLEDQHFLELYNRAYTQGMQLPVSRAHVLYSAAKQVAWLPGAAAECGVYRGGTASLIADAVRGTKRLYLFDTFCGIPAGTPGKDNRYLKGGEFSDTSPEAVRVFVSGSRGTNVHLRVGAVPATFEGCELETFAFVHLDMDIYQPTKDALEFFYPRMTPGGILICDDYGFEECQGVYLAVDEFSKRVAAPAIVLPTGQAMMVGH